MHKLFTEYAKYYNFLAYGHRREAEFIKNIVKKHKKSDGNDMLIFACGTGLHEKYLKKQFKIVGIDKSLTMLKIAKRSNPDITYKQGDMRSVKLNKKFDIVVCLDSIWYNTNYSDLNKTLKNFYHHLKRGGLAVFSLYPWKHNFKQNEILIDKYTKDDLNIVLFVLDYDPDPNDTVHDSIFTLLLWKNKKLRVETERHKLGLFEFEKVLGMVKKIFSKVFLYERDFSGKHYHHEPAIFVCLK